MAQQVNGIDMAGKTQSDAVLLLRDTPLGGTVSMVVSRIVLEEDEQTPYPRELVRLTWHANTASHVGLLLKSTALYTFLPMHSCIFRQNCNGVRNNLCLYLIARLELHVSLAQCYNPAELYTSIRSFA